MNVYKDKTLLIAGGIESVVKTLIHHASKCGAKEIRVLDGNEERLVAMRDELMAQHSDAVEKVKYYCADVCDSDSVDDYMPGVDYVLYIPSINSVNDIESYPADACTALLGSTDNIMQSANKHNAEKMVVLIPAYSEPLYKTPDLLTVLLEKVVVAQGRYQDKDAKTTICCAQMDSDVTALIDYTIAVAKNGDTVKKQDGVHIKVPCHSPSFERDDFTII